NVGNGPRQRDSRRHRGRGGEEGGSRRYQDLTTSRSRSKLYVGFGFTGTGAGAGQTRRTSRCRSAPRPVDDKLHFAEGPAVSLPCLRAYFESGRPHITWTTEA